MRELRKVTGVAIAQEVGTVPLLHGTGFDRYESVFVHYSDLGHLSLGRTHHETAKEPESLMKSIS